MIAPSSLATAPPMKTRHPVSGDNVMVTALLILLALPVTVLWFRDRTHHYSSESRVGWPPAPAAKP